jgi:hypothetical protein
VGLTVPKQTVAIDMIGVLPWSGHEPADIPDKFARRLGQQKNLNLKEIWLGC